MNCGTCVNFTPRTPYEGKCTLNPPVPVIVVQDREMTTDEVTEENENGDKTYRIQRMRTLFTQPDVFVNDKCPHFVPTELSRTVYASEPSAEPPAETPTE